eukprot:2459838-Rhodomonas_salina.1
MRKEVLKGRANVGYRHMLCTPAHPADGAQHQRCEGTPSISKTLRLLCSCLSSRRAVRWQLKAGALDTKPCAQRHLASLLGALDVLARISPLATR